MYEKENRYHPNEGDHQNNASSIGTDGIAYDN